MMTEEEIINKVISQVQNFKDIEQLLTPYKNEIIIRGKSCEPKEELYVIKESISNVLNNLFAMRRMIKARPKKYTLKYFVGKSLTEMFVNEASFLINSLGIGDIAHPKVWLKNFRTGKYDFILHLLSVNEPLYIKVIELGQKINFKGSYFDLHTLYILELENKFEILHGTDLINVSPEESIYNYIKSQITLKLAEKIANESTHSIINNQYKQFVEK